MKSRVCLLSACNSAQLPLAEITVPRMKAYAGTHGYEHRFILSDTWARPRAWPKVEALGTVLAQDFDVVLWMDVDAIVLRHDIDIRTALVENASLQMAWHGPDTVEILAPDFIPHFNCGVMLVRVNDWSRDFFRRVWDTGQLPHHWSDQATILHLLGHDECLGLGPSRPEAPDRLHLARLDPAWNSVPGLAMAPDPIVHHYAGLENPATRLRLLQMDAASADARAQAPIEVRQAFARQLSLWREDAFMRDWITAERNAALAGFQPVAAERQQFLVERDDARAQLAALRSSTSWRVTAPLRWAVERLRGG